MKEQIGVVGVDAGLCWIGDPCYIHKDTDEEQPKEWGRDWSGFLDTLWGKEKEKGYPTRTQFNYDMGHEGLGVCVSTGFGDGCYPVYADIEEIPNWGKRIKSVTIVFIEDKDSEVEKCSKLKSIFNWFKKTLSGKQ